MFRTRRDCYRVGFGALAACLMAGTVLTSGSAAAARTPLTAKRASSNIKIVFVSGPLSDSFFPPLYNGAKQASHDLGISFNYIPINEGDIEQSSVQTMQAAIAEHPSAIVVGDFITSAVDPLIKKAVKDGIPVYVDQSGQDQWKGDGAFGFVGQQGPAAGEAAGREFASLKDKDTLCVDNVPGNPYLTQVCDGLAAATKAAGGTSATLPLPTADATNPLKVTQDIGAYLNAHKGITGIFAENAADGSDAVTAVQTARLGGKVSVGTMELSKEDLSQIRSGQMAFLINEQPYLDGYYGVLFAYQYVKYGLAPVGVVNTGPSIIDKSNIGKITAVTKKYPGILGSD